VDRHTDNEDCNTSHPSQGQNNKIKYGFSFQEKHLATLLHSTAVESRLSYIVVAVVGRARWTPDESNCEGSSKRRCNVTCSAARHIHHTHLHKARHTSKQTAILWTNVWVISTVISAKGASAGCSNSSMLSQIQPVPLHFVDTNAYEQREREQAKASDQEHSKHAWQHT